MCLSITYTGKYSQANILCHVNELLQVFMQTYSYTSYFLQSINEDFYQHFLKELLHLFQVTFFVIKNILALPIFPFSNPQFLLHLAQTSCAIELPFSCCLFLPHGCNVLVHKYRFSAKLHFQCLIKHYFPHWKNAILIIHN